MIFRFLKATIFLLTAILFSSLVNAQGGIDYNTMVNSGDDHYNNGDYINAKSSYEYALRIRPDEEYPKQKLDKTIEKLRQKMARMEEYSTIINEADTYFRNKEYDKAKVMYRQASTIIPTEGYAEEKINEIKGRKEKERKNQIAYDDAIYRADKFVKYRKYEQAIQEYNKALELLPTEQYPRDKIIELEKHLEDLVAASNEYEDVIKNADRLYFLKYFENAKLEYQKASEARPEEEYPKRMIEEMDKMLVQKNEFDQIVTLADEFYISKDLEQAKLKYQEALKIYPNESYPQDMIDKVNNGLRKQLGKGEMYDKSIAEGDKFLAAKDYTNALQEYNNAIELKPNELYPQRKIEDINRILDEMAYEEQVYALAIKMGDQYLNAESFMAAKKEYEKALKIDPDADYPNEQMAIVTKALEEQEAINNSYNLSVEKGNEFMKEGKFDLALKEYENALVILPHDEFASGKVDEIKALQKQLKENKILYPEVIAEADNLLARNELSGARVKYIEASNLDKSKTYPAEKIAEIDKLLVKQQEINDAYTRAIATADIFYKNKEYERAKEEYQKAADLKPGATYPQDRLGKIASMKPDDMQQGDEYTETLKRADNLFDLLQYDEAKLAYLKASNLRPKEQYPKYKLEEIESLQSGQAATIAQYNKFVSAGDRMMESEDYDGAKERYNQATAIFPNEKYPQDKLTEIDQIILAKELEVQDKYNEAITEADELFDKKEYTMAGIKYELALKYKPNEGYPAQRLEEIDGLASEQEKLEDQYSRLVASADMLFTSKEYQEAKTKYIEASALFPNEEHPKNRIAEINLIHKAENQTAQSEYDIAISEGDKFFAASTYTKALDSYYKAKALNPEDTYPQEMIDKILEVLDDRAMRKIQTSSITLQNNQEEKFSFEPLETTDRKSSVLIISARGIASRSFKVFVNFGKGGSKNGGYILPITPGDSQEEYIIPLGKQHKWLTEDNNWFKLVPQGGSVEVTGIEIAKE